MEREIIAGLMARGLPLHVAQGIVANMVQESRLDPGINEIAPLVAGSRGGYGLNQWTGPRRRAYEAFATERGAPLDDLQTQLDFTLYELQGPERGAYNALLDTTDPVQAAQVYSEKFLRPGIPHMDRRLAEARRLAGIAPDGYTENALGRIDPREPEQPRNKLAELAERMQPVQLDPRQFMVAAEMKNYLGGV